MNVHTTHLVLILFPFLATAAFIDLKTRRIPNPLVLFGLFASLLCHLVLDDGKGFQYWLYGTMAGFLIFMPLYLLKGMAAGDVKLMAAVGGFVGPAVVMKIGLVACVFGGIGAILIVIFKGRIKDLLFNIHAILLNYTLTGRTPNRSASNDASAVSPSVGGMPYAPAIALAAFAVMISH